MQSIFCLKPDCILRKKYLGIVRYFAEQGASFRLAIIGQVDKTLYSLMYGSAFLHSLDFWEFNQKTFKHGPVLYCLIDGIEHNVLLANKGSALPELEVNLSSIRSAFLSSSRCFNLIHVPDSFEQGLDEIKMMSSSVDITKWYEVNSELNVEDIFAEIHSHQYGSFHDFSGEVFEQSLLKRITHKFCCKSSKFNFIDKPKLYALMAESAYYSCRLLAELFKGRIQVVGTISALGYIERIIGLLEDERIYISDFERYLLEIYFRYPTTDER
jgi:nucleoside diphosphate kinase